MQELLDLIREMLEERGYKNVIGFYLQADWISNTVVFGVNYMATGNDGKFVKLVTGDLLKRLTHGEIVMVKKSDVPVL